MPDILTQPTLNPHIICLYRTLPTGKYCPTPRHVWNIGTTAQHATQLREEVRHYERLAVEDHVRDFVTELCKIPAARNEFGLRRIQFSSHTNSLNKTEVSEVIASQKTPTNQKAKSKYNAEELVCSAIVQQYHVMIQGGLEYSYMTNGIA